VNKINDCSGYDKNIQAEATHKKLKYFKSNALKKFCRLRTKAKNIIERE
jgi:hypothetical protein